MLGVLRFSSAHIDLKKEKKKERYDLGTENPFLIGGVKSSNPDYTTCGGDFFFGKKPMEVRWVKCPRMTHLLLEY